MRTPMEKNTQPVARTLSESIRDAQYACAIQTFKSDAKLTLDFLVNALIGMVIVGTIPLICYLIVTML
jgi:hypothetical protein